LVGLIEEQHTRVSQQCQREIQLLSRSAGQVAGHQLLSQREVELSEDRVPASEPFLSTHASAAAEHHKVIIGGEQLEQSGCLRAVPDATAHSNGSLVGAKQARADAQERRLSCTVLTGERNNFAGAHFEIHIIEDHRPLEALGDARGDELVTGRHSVWPGWITVAVVAPLAFISAVIDTFWREAMRLHESPLTTE